MSVGISKELKASIIDGPPNDEKWPFHREGGKSFLRFDAIRQRNKVVGGCQVLETVFMWRGKETFSQFTSGIRFESDKPFEFSGIEGRMVVDLV